MTFSGHFQIDYTKSLELLGNKNYHQNIFKLSFLTNCPLKTFSDGFQSTVLSIKNPNVIV